MLVAIVTTSWPRSEDDAAGHFVRADARDRERRGAHIEVIAPPLSRDGGGAFGWPGAAARMRAHPLRAALAARWVLEARRLVARLDADLVVAHWAIPCAWPIGVVTRGALEVVSHGGDVRGLARAPLAFRSLVAVAIAEKAARWTFVSARLRDDLLEGLGAAARSKVERVAHVSPAPIEMPDVSEAARAIRRSLAGRRTAVCVGRLVTSKRVDRAVEHVARGEDFDALVIVGDGPERARLERLARDRGVDARFLGVLGRRDALAWIGAADALLHASVAEGLSTVVREAEALGTRVVRL
ncbi:MAG TPA: glycosyltransferase [Polyangiaceae bacterium]|jgi:glycosyltransferase involved in cell wall biosynthesis|nr:glycosyltransferase [Polyangiaceae bacterium]